MICSKCKSTIEDSSNFCSFCGKKQTETKRKKMRGNGQGTIEKTKTGKYVARVTLGYDSNGKRKTKSKSFDKKSDAVAALPTLKLQPVAMDNNITFESAYNSFIAIHSQRVGKSTIDNYKYAFDHYKALWYVPLNCIKAEHLQKNIDQCESGKRTKENMKAIASLIFKWGISNDIVDKNYAENLFTGKEETSERTPFTKDEILAIYSAVGTVRYADYIIVLIFTGFRPSELFELKHSNYHGTYFIGGSKTDAGKNRIVPIPNVIQPIVQNAIENSNKLKSEYIFCNPSGSQMDLSHFRTRYYYPALETIGVSKLPVYSCRHTYASMLADTDSNDQVAKQRLMGHSKFEMTQHYTHPDIAALERITDQLTIVQENIPKVV